MSVIASGPHRTQNKRSNTYVTLCSMHIRNSRRLLPAPRSKYEPSTFACTFNKSTDGAGTERGRSGVGAGSEQGKSEVSSATYIADRLLLRVLLEGTKGES